MQERERGIPFFYRLECSPSCGQKFAAQLAGKKKHRDAYPAKKKMFRGWVVVAPRKGNNWPETAGIGDA